LKSYFEAIKNFENGNIAPVYLLLGDDFYLRQNILKKAYQNAPTDEKRIYYGKEKSEKDEKDNNFLEDLYSVGIFSSQKIVVYKDIDKLRSQYRNRLNNYFDSPDSDILLILTAKSKKLKFVRQISKKVNTVNVWTPFPQKYPSFVSREIKRRGYKIESQALDLLLSETDDNLSHTFSELEKVIATLGDSKKITAEAVKTIVGGEKKYQMHQFLEAVGKNNYDQAINICMNLLEEGASVPFFTASLFNYFMDTWAYYEVHHPDKDEKRYPIQKQLDKYQKSNEIYKGANYGKIFQNIREADLKAKSTSLPSKEIIIPLIFKIMEETKVNNNQYKGINR